MATVATPATDTRTVALAWLKRQIAEWREILGRLGRFGAVVLLLGFILLLSAAGYEHYQEMLADKGQGVKALDAAINALRDAAVWVEVVKEIGIALVVAAVAVVGYELLQHTPHFKRAHDDLKKAQEDLKKEIEEIRRAREGLVLATQPPHEAIARHLNTLLSGDESQELRAAVLDFIRYADQIGSHAKRQDDVTAHKESVEYMRYLGWLANQYCKDTASKLVQLLDSMNQKRPGGLYRYAPPDQREVARQILAAQMRCMGPGEHYASVASLAMYDTFDHVFIDATKEALARGTRIDRIFNIIQFEHQLLDPLTFRRFKSVVARQRAFGNNYRIRFLGTAALPLMDGNVLAAVRLQATVEAFRSMFFGLFVHEKGDILLFDAPSADVSSLVLEYCGSERAGMMRCPKALLFEHLWELCSDKADPFAGSVFDPDWMPVAA